MAPRLSLIPSLAILALAASVRADPGYSLFNESIVGVTNSSISGYIGSLDTAYTGDGSPSSADATATFGGMNQNGDDGGIMTFTGSCRTSTTYGQLHVVTTGSLDNSFYNANNPIYYDSRDNSFHPEGTPDGLASLGFAGFTDTLQFGGQLQNGYVARYVFHIDGTNDGIGSAADLVVNVGTDNDAFFDFNPGSIDTTWGSKGFAVNGQDPQTINVQFSDQVVFNTYDLGVGSQAYGQSNFGSTASLTGIVLFDANGNIVPSSQWTLTSASGTTYNRLDAVPEPGSFVALALGGLAFLSKKRRAK